ncbi:MAG: hypothetical protein ACF8MJ_10915 [Phycisphaerales bacterium JB050]
MEPVESKPPRTKRRLLKRAAACLLLLVVLLGCATLYFASLQPVRSDEYRAEYERVADALYADPEQARRNFELVVSRPEGALLGDLDLSAGVWQPFVASYERGMPRGTINLSALSRAYWDPAFALLRIAMIEGDEEDLEAAIDEVFARMRCRSDLAPDSKVLSWTGPIDRLRRHTLEMIEEEPDISPERLEWLADAVEAVPELPDFEIFMDLAMLAYKDTVSHHHSRGGWFLPSTAPGVASSHYGLSEWPTSGRWLDIAAVLMPRASESIALCEEFVEPVYEAYRNGVLLVDLDSDLFTDQVIEDAQNYFVGLTAPALSTQYRIWLEARAMRVYLPIELRVLAHERRTGEWPTRIEQIVKGEIPIDPATEQPITLTPSENENDPPRVGRADLVD